MQSANDAKINMVYVGKQRTQDLSSGPYMRAMLRATMKRGAGGVGHINLNLSCSLHTLHGKFKLTEGLPINSYML